MRGLFTKFQLKKAKKKNQVYNISLQTDFTCVQTPMFYYRNPEPLVKKKSQNFLYVALGLVLYSCISITRFVFVDSAQVVYCCEERGAENTRI